MSNTINPILIVFIVLLVGALGLTNQALKQSNTLVIQLQENKDTVIVRDTVFVDNTTTVEKGFVDLAGLVGKQIEEINDSTEVGLRFYTMLVGKLVARGYLSPEGELTYEQIHFAYHRAMNDYNVKDHAISEEMLIVFGMYTY